MSPPRASAPVKPPRRPPGGAPVINAVVAHNEETGETTTVADRIVASIRAGVPPAEAAAVAGVTRQTYQEWVRDGARAAREYHAGALSWGKMTRYQRECVAFSERVAQTVAELQTTLGALAMRQARGGAERTITTTKRKGDVVVEETRRVETTLPEGEMIRWLLERRFGEQWGRRQLLEVSGPGGGPIEVASPLDRLLGALDEIAQRKAAMEAHGVEAPAAPAPPSLPGAGP